MVEERNVGSSESEAVSTAVPEAELARRQSEPQVDGGADEPVIVVEIIDIDGICGVY
ncbi:hypothetical protein [Ferrimicrobium sp.]|uniref:hypothetical protein n=1 Tax=Ferrimicrobium sp. TaxID=2926050 RepID=UPI002632DE43|nr:hypothetical protein [Ferrimicrobium sp.]